MKVRRAALGHVVEDSESLDAARDWPTVLSNGEKQRIAFVRLFVSGRDRPVVLLDNATNAVSCDLEQVLFSHARELHYALVSVSSRTPPLEGDTVLTFRGTQLVLPDPVSS